MKLKTTCPRCGNTDTFSWPHIYGGKTPPNISCGNCLMNDCEIVKLIAEPEGRPNAQDQTHQK
jgi:transcription elongation factor Elf1